MAVRDRLVPVTEFRAHINQMLADLGQSNVVLLRHSRPAAVVISPDRFERLLDRIEDLEDALAIAKHALEGDAGRPLDEVVAEIDRARTG